MKAIVQHEFGGPETLQVAEVDSPTPGAGEVVVKVTASTVNPLDTLIREGKALKEFTPLPFIPGWDVAGTVAEVGEGAPFEPGQRVFGMPRFPKPGKALAEYCVVDARNLAATPDSLSDAEAAALPMAGMTAWQAFHDTVEVKEGEKVLINGAGGGVGHLAVQIAAAAGATITAIASPSKHEWLRSLGAHEVVDYNDEAAMAALEGFTTAFNLAPGSWVPTLEAVAPGGHLITISGGADELNERAEEAGIHHHVTSVNTRDEWLAALVDLVEGGKLRPHISATYPLERAADAHRELDEGHAQGKIVITIG
ncbi:NADP-dependent oxidoreductase [Corynebacterium liangguodongii]|uniref:NADPH:quinone reductase n=1 Tax=Corynebacterium liangguodongii TaxID=2079535 RepID=A0A2S0WFN0_9CORY|nr:NADP-dependent oxidoreductase [Corynebacterium liangguodongii]AWB84566.1 NADPH:quinone reductase [Corynebacterium liangguodongii]PWB98850.1 NADP-dependent oxidoreductase [Corynebacterium liangguodongii]